MENFITIDESKPLEARLKKNCTRINIGNPTGSEVNVRGLRETFKQLGRESGNSLKSIAIEESSRIRHLDIFDSALLSVEKLYVDSDEVSSIDCLTFLPNLNYIDFNGRQEKSLLISQLENMKLKVLALKITNSAEIAALPSLRSIHTLLLRSYPHANLTALQNVKFLDLRVTGGRLENRQGLENRIIEHEEYVDCRRLLNIGVLGGRSVVFYSCGKVDWMSLQNSVRVEHIVFRSCSSLTNISFCSKMPNLKSITVTASKCRNVDFKDLGKLPNLDSIWLSPGARLKNLSTFLKCNPRLLLANHEHYYIGDLEVSAEVYFRERDLRVTPPPTAQPENAHAPSKDPAP